MLDYEVAQQKAQTLGDLGRQVEAALAALRAFDDARQTDSATQADGGGGADAKAGQDAGSGAGRAVLVDRAAERVWALMIQRELCGLRHWEAVVKSYGIPREVLNRMGATGKG